MEVYEAGLSWEANRRLTEGGRLRGATAAAGRSTPPYMIGSPAKNARIWSLT
jgi:hypothetical protein